MNYMKQVANMLGVELNEEFLIAIDGKTESNHKYKLTKNGCCHEFDGDWYHTESINRILSGIYEIVKLPKPILDEAEKEYLSAVIKPFRNCVKSISKYGLSTCEYIAIVYYDKLTEKEYSMFFPFFGKGQMYKGMETNKEYALEELGL